MTNLLTNPNPQYLRDNILWRVRLNDDRIIYQNDIDGQPNSWLQLKRYLDENRDKYILDMHIVFRDHYEHIGYEKNFFFFTHKMLGHFATGYQQYFYIAGCGHDINEIHCKHFLVPELLLMEEDIRQGNSPLCNRGIIAHPDYIGLFEKYHDE